MVDTLDKNNRKAWLVTDIFISDILYFSLYFFVFWCDFIIQSSSWLKLLLHMQITSFLCVVMPMYYVCEFQFLTPTGFFRLLSHNRSPLQTKTCLILILW